MDIDRYESLNSEGKSNKPVGLISRACSSSLVKHILPTFCLALLILGTAYCVVLLWFPQDEAKSQTTCHLQPGFHVPCAPGSGGHGIISMRECFDLDCCWREDLKLCYHSFPSPYNYLIDTRAAQAASQGVIKANRKYSPSKRKIRQELAFEIHQISESRTRIVLRTAAAAAAAAAARQSNKQQSGSGNKSRLLLPRQQANSQLKPEDYGSLFNFLLPDPDNRITEFSSGTNRTSKVKILVHEPRFGITVTRSDEGHHQQENSVLLSTVRGPLIVTDNYWEWTLHLQSGGTLYGRGNLRFNGDSNWIYNNENETTRPAFLAINPEDGLAVSCYIDYQGPLQVHVQKESGLVVLRGASLPSELGIEVLSGPEPVQASQQLAELHGLPARTLLRPSLLGLHLCPELAGQGTSYDDGDESWKAVEETIRAMDEVKAAWDSHCLRPELGLALEHGWDEARLGLVAEGRKILQSHGKSFASHLTPMLFDNVVGSLRKDLEKGSCLLRNTSGVYVGAYGKRAVVYPDWINPKTRELAQAGLGEYQDDLNPDFILLRDAWPKDESQSHYEFPRKLFDYLPEELEKLMSRLTVPANLEDRHYAVHNAYAVNFVKFISESAGIAELRGHYSNNPNGEASWPRLRSFLEAGIATASLGQLPSAMYVCGAADTRARIDDELCLRWYGAAVAWPHIMSLPEKSGGGKRLSRQASQLLGKLLRLRASLASYQHTAIATFLDTGFPLLSATGLIYPDSPEEARLDDPTHVQFFWGDSVLVGLVVQQGRVQIQMKIPGKPVWRHLQGGDPINPNVPITVTAGQIVTLLRPGRILPVHENPLGSSSATMLQDLTLLANLGCSDDATCRAEGRIYYGDDVRAGAYLNVDLLGTRLTLSNLSGVQAVACNQATRIKSTVIRDIQLLGNRTFLLQKNLCDLPDDTYSLDLLGLSVVSEIFVID